MNRKENEFEKKGGGKERRRKTRKSGQKVKK